TIELENNIWQVMEFQHVKPGKGAAFVRSKLRNLRNGNIQEKTFRAGEKVNRAHIENKTMQYLYASDDTQAFMDTSTDEQIENKTMQYLYASGDTHAFIDTSTYEQIKIQTSQIEHELKFIKENMEVSIIMYEGEIIGVDLPNNVSLEVTETEPGLKGDTVSG